MTDLARLLLFSVIGRILIHLWMSFPLPTKLDSIKFFHDLHECSKCSGVYIYSLLFSVYGVDVLQMFGLPHINYIGEIVSGGLVSFLVYLITSGYKAVFEVVVI